MLDRLRKSITALAFGILGLAPCWAGAQIPSSPIAIRPDAPERYTVVPGDTLWGISERFTDSPWRWPELWNFNREQIKNPHLIYPGDVIVLDRSAGRLTLAGREEVPERVAPPAAGEKPAPAQPPAAEVPRPAAEPAPKPRAEPPTKSVRLSPRIRAERLDKEEIPSIPLGAIEPFLSRPLVVEANELDAGPRIVATEDNRVLLGLGNVAYVRGMRAAPDADWFVYRRGAPLVDPDTNSTLGFEAVYLGAARVTRLGDPATVQLTAVKQEIVLGDRLVPAGRAQPVNYAPHPPHTAIKARVMSIYGGLGHVGEAGPLSIVTLNRGRVDGLEMGHVLALYRHGRTVADITKPGAVINVPDERYGLLFVFRIFERVSYALVMRVTMPVRTLDVAQNP